MTTIDGSTSDVKFKSISETLLNNGGVTEGKMMRSDALKFHDKVFCFLNDKTGEMGFRLGPGFNAKEFGILRPKPLSPFKTKPPLKGWFIINSSESELWPSLAELALEFTKTI